jgi:hypothetical protein
MNKPMDMHATFGFHKTPFTREIEVSDMLPMPHIDEQRDALLECHGSGLCDPSAVRRT